MKSTPPPVKPADDLGFQIKVQPPPAGVDQPQSDDDFYV
jgi:hypothetical protein